METEGFEAALTEPSQLFHIWFTVAFPREHEVEVHITRERENLCAPVNSIWKLLFYSRVPKSNFTSKLPSSWAILIVCLKLNMPPKILISTMSFNIDRRGEGFTLHCWLCSYRSLSRLSSARRDSPCSQSSALTKGDKFCVRFLIPSSSLGYRGFVW